MLALAVACLTTANAQAQESALEFWPEVDVWLRLSPAWRASMYVPISKNIETKYREGSLLGQADFAWGHTRYHRRMLDEGRAQNLRAYMVRGGYLAGKSLGDDGATYRERTVLAEFHGRIPLTGNMLLSQRLRTDFRWLGDDAEYSQRWRYRVMVEKEYTAGRSSIVPYVNAEPYYDSRYNTVNRIRVIGGATFSWTHHAAVETNWTYQHDTRSSVTNLNALNVILHVFFETRKARPSS